MCQIYICTCTYVKTNGNIFWSESLSESRKTKINLIIRYFIYTHVHVHMQNKWEYFFKRVPFRISQDVCLIPLELLPPKYSWKTEFIREWKNWVYPRMFGTNSDQTNFSIWIWLRETGNLSSRFAGCREGSISVASVATRNRKMNSLLFFNTRFFSLMYETLLVFMWHDSCTCDMTHVHNINCKLKVDHPTLFQYTLFRFNVYVKLVMYMWHDSCKCDMTHVHDINCKLISLYCFNVQVLSHVYE